MTTALKIRDLAARVGEEIAVSPWVDMPQERIDLFAKAERVLAENGYARLLGAFADLDEGARKALLEAWSQPGALTGGLNYYRASPMYPPSAEDPGARKLQLKPGDFTVRVPTLVLWGERDTALLPGCIEGLGEVVPDLKLVRFPDASHWIAREQTARVIREIEAFTIHA